MKIAWTHHGPPRLTSIAVPPAPTLIDWYALGYDAAREQIVYACRPDDDERGGEMHAFDGASWKKITKGRFALEENLEGGAWDSARGGFVVWSAGMDYQVKRARARGLLLTDKGAKELKTSGDDPILEPTGEDEEIGTFDKSALFAFDLARKVWVCLSRAGVWELDAAGVWTRKSSDASLVPNSWDNNTGEGVFDPVSKRAFFFMQGEENKYALVLLAWDGDKLERISLKGLPKMMLGLFDPIAQIATHDKHGVVIHAGAGKLFRLSPAGWEALAEASDPPPKMENACLAYDPKRDLFVLGPGKHEGAGGSNRNDVFFVLRNGKWERQGVAVVHSPLDKASYSQCRLAHVGRDWYALGSHSLKTWRWTNDAWKEITSDKVVGNGLLGSWEKQEIVTVRDKLHSVMPSGAVFALEPPSKWTTITKKDPAMKGRIDFALAADPSGRLVAWGGTVKNRKQNDTLFFEGKKWRAAKKSSPQPMDFKHGKDDVYVEPMMTWDSALGAMVRFGYEEVAVLQADETWKPYKPKNYKSNISPRAYGHYAVHDAQTGETLLIDFTTDDARSGEHAGSAHVLRFDLGECTPLATIEYPPELAQKRQHDAATYHALCDTFSFDPKTRSLYAQVLEDTLGTYKLDLGALFDRAKSMGARKVPTGGAAKEEPPKLYCVKGGKLETSTKPKAGFVRASELDRAALAALASVPVHEISISKTAKGSPKSRLGGEPSGVTPKTWPRVRKAPMGFLFQIETGSLLKKHAGVAVFCALDGEAANEEDENAVVLLGTKDFAKTCALPEGVPMLPAREITIGEAQIEIDEVRAHALAERDGDLGAAFERLQTMKGVAEHDLSDKLGGIPAFLQGEANVKRHKFIAQIDFDSISTSKAWPDAGLMGCIYVFVSDDEKSGGAFWQYT